MIQQWWKDAKFGMFIHWGIYSVPAGEYKGVKTDNIAEWIMHDLHIPADEYVKFAASFTGEYFDADKIVSFAKDCGMKYLVFTAKHHDGFAMYHSKVDTYNTSITPFKKDPIRELKNACDKYGIAFGLYYSQAQDWHDPDGCEDGENGEGKDFEKYFKNKCLPQVKELLTNYAPVKLLWFDTPMYMTAEQSKELKGFVLSIQPDCMISGRIGNGLGDYVTTGDNFIPLLPIGYSFEVPATTNGSWGYNKFDTDWISAKKIIRRLVKIIARGGNYLLNVGPRCDGSIPAECTEILKEIGSFLKYNGDSIYATVPLPPYPYDIDWGYFTYKSGRLFIHVFEDLDRIYLLNIHNKPLKAYILKDKMPIKVTERCTCEGDSSWLIKLPRNAEKDIDRVICVEVEGGELEFEPIKR